MIEDDKRIAAEAAVAEVRDGMLVGLGTGSTAAFAITAIGRLGLGIEAVATSVATERLAIAHGIRVRAFDQVATVDLTIDGADEIDDHLRAIKGAGGAMLREKVVAAASRRMVVIADGSKRVAAIGAAKLPVEVLPFAQSFVSAALAEMGGDPVPRGGFVTDNGNVIIDCRFNAVGPEALAAALAAIPGVLGHGLFLHEVDAAYVADRGVVTRLERHRSSR
jgi:ribose 5-phosphate isomerase A